MRIHARWRLLPMMAAIVLTLVMGLTMGGCDFSFSCGTDDTGEAGGVETYTDPDYGYSFSYPSDWVLDEDTSLEVESGIGRAGGVSVFDPEGAKADGSYVDLFEVSVYELGFAVDESMMPEIKPEIEALIADAGSQDTTWETIEPLADTEVSGLSGFKTTAKHSVDGVPVTSTLYFLFNGTIEYELIVQAAPDTWDAAQADFGAIVAGFKPGTAAGAAAGTTAESSQ